MSARERERGERKLLHSVSLQKKQTGFDIGEEEFPPSPVGSNLFYPYRDTEPFPCPALVLQWRVFPKRDAGERDGMKRGARGKNVKGYEGEERSWEKRRHDERGSGGEWRG